jgi:hypothetical protein
MSANRGRAEVIDARSERRDGPVPDVTSGSLRLAKNSATRFAGHQRLLNVWNWQRDATRKT